MSPSGHERTSFVSRRSGTAPGGRRPGPRRLVERSYPFRVADSPLSLCRTCVFVREVSGRHGQVYLLCRNEAIAVKYLPQPVLECGGHSPSVKEAKQRQARP